MAATSAVVVGGGNGIGRATAARLAADGARVVVADVDLLAAEATADQLRRAGGDAVAHEVDVTSESSVEALMDFVVDSAGSLDWAVNLVGIAAPPTPSGEVAIDDFRRIVEVNLIGMFLAVRAQVRRMVPAGGSIVTVSSAAGLVAVPGAAAYTASKHAVIGLTKSMAMDYVGQGVRINCVAPSHIETQMIRSFIDDSDDPSATRQTLMSSVPIGRLGSPGDVVGGVAYLLSDDAAYVTGSVLSIDGGFVAV